MLMYGTARAGRMLGLLGKMRANALLRTKPFIEA